MMTRIKLLSCTYLLFTISYSGLAQKTSYKDSIETYFRKYVRDHEVVKGKDKQLIRFFTADEKYRIAAGFEKKTNSPWFLMETSGPLKKNYRVYGTIHFNVNDTDVSLHIYQSQDLMGVEKYRDHLFIPFTDATSGEETYSSGRYIDLTVNDITGENILIDFNKAYNPYCAYVSDKYNCPVPPKENYLSVAIRAGEKVYLKPH